MVNGQAMIKQWSSHQWASESSFKKKSSSYELKEIGWYFYVCEKKIVRQATNQILQITEKHHRGEIKNNWCLQHFFKTRFKHNLKENPERLND